MKPIAAYCPGHKIGLFLVVICASMLLLRAPSCLTPIWNIDEAVSACVANVILDHGLPYQDAVDHRGPLTYYAYALIFFMFGKNNMLAIHVALGGLLAVVMTLLYGCGVAGANQRTGSLAAGCFALLSFALYEVGDLFAAHTEHLLILFTTLAVFLLIVGMARSQSWWIFLSGSAYGLGFLAKQPALLDFAAAIGFLLCLPLFRTESVWSVVQRICFLIAGFGVIVGGSVAYFFYRDALHDFFFYFWTYNVTIYLPEIPLIHRLMSLPKPVNYLIKRFFPLAVCWGAGSMFAIYRFFSMGRSKAFSQEDWGFFWGMWSVSSLIGAALSGRAFGHYAIQILPALSLVAGMSADNMITAVSNAFRRVSSLSKPTLVLLKSALLCGLIIMALPVGVRFFQTLPEMSQNRAEHALIHYIKQNSRAEDQIFVWGFYPEIYVLSDRMPASRYVFANVLTGLVPWTNTGETIDTSYAVIPETWDILMAELSAQKPRLVIDTSPGRHRSYQKYPPERFPRLQTFLQTDYGVAHEILGENNQPSFRVFRRNDETRG